MSLASLPFEEEALAKAELVDLVETVIPVARAEDLVIYETVAWRDRDRADVERLLAQHGSRMDLERARRVVSEFADVLGTPERMAELDSLIERTRKR